MTSLTAHRAVATSLLFITAVCLTSCASVSHHQFSEPAAGWQTKTGQLMYRTAKATLIGEAIVRLSKTGDFELTVSKGPGITLLSLRQDAGFAEFNANFTDQRWSGPTSRAPPQLRGWLGLRDQFLRAPNPFPACFLARLHCAKVMFSLAALLALEAKGQSGIGIQSRILNPSTAITAVSVGACHQTIQSIVKLTQTSL